MNSNKVYSMYKKGLELYLDKTINFFDYNNEIINSNLYFGKSESINKNLSTDFYSLINNLYLENLDESIKNILETKNEIDNEVMEIIIKTYKQVITKKSAKYVMYNPPLPEHNVENGSLVLEFVYGKNTKVISDEEYVEITKKQKEFIKSINERLIKEVEEKLGLKCSIFIEKRI